MASPFGCRIVASTLSDYVTTFKYFVATVLSSVFGCCLHFTVDIPPSASFALLIGLIYAMNKAPIHYLELFLSGLLVGELFGSVAHILPTKTLLRIGTGVLGYGLFSVFVALNVEEPLRSNLKSIVSFFCLLTKLGFAHLLLFDLLVPLDVVAGVMLVVMCGVMVNDIEHPRKDHIQQAADVFANLVGMAALLTVIVVK